MRMFTGLFVAALFVLCAVPAGAQEFGSQPRYQWLATPCEKWSCAIAAMATSEGDPFFVVLPTKSSEHPWVVLKRVEAGSVEGPVDNTFTIESYSAMSEASARFASIDTLNVPMLVTTVDGGMLVVRLTAPVSKRRAVTR